MTGRTAEGRQAYAILSWANGDPQNRAAEAAGRVDVLALDLMGGSGNPAALIEVRDVGTVLARLAGTSRSPVRLASEHSILAQVIDLSWDPLKHPRDPHTGKFIGHGGAAAPGAKAAMKTGSRARPGALKGPAGDIGGIIKSISSQAHGPTQMEQALAEDNAAANRRTAALEAHVKALQAQLDAISKKMDAADKAIEEEKSAEENDKKDEHRADLAVEIGAVAMGVAISAFLGDASLSAAGLVPFIVKQALDRAPEISRALAKFHIVGKGHGRTWVAHPIAKPAQAAVAGIRVIKSSPKVQTIGQQVAGLKSAVAKPRALLRRTPSASS